MIINGRDSVETPPPPASISDAVDVGTYRWVCDLLGYDYAYFRKCIYENISINEKLNSYYIHKRGSPKAWGHMAETVLAPQLQIKVLQ